MGSFLYEKYRECGYRVTTDSRSLTGGEIFFALRGENFDGNVFALSALEKGAALAVVNDDAVLGDDPRLYSVPDPFTALRDLAIEHRENLRIPVVGLTGTNGKTSSTTILKSVLEKTISAKVGLIGTIIGFIKAVLAANSQELVSRADLLGGSMEALVSAAMGLMVAIPVAVMYGVLRTRMDRLVLEFEAAASSILGYIANKEAAAKEARK